MKLNILCLAVESMIKAIRGRGKLSFGQALLRSVQYSHIRHFPFDLFISTTCESHSR